MKKLLLIFLGFIVICVLGYCTGGHEPLFQNILNWFTQNWFAFFGILGIFLKLYQQDKNHKTQMTTLTKNLERQIAGQSATLNEQMTLEMNKMHRQFFLQKYDADTKLLLPVLLELLEDLSILESGLIFRGMWCPAAGEHRVPEFSSNDLEEKVSFAKRGNDFLLLECRIIKNCREIFCLGSKEKMSDTIEVCKEIKIYLADRKKDQISKSEQIANTITNIVAYNTTGKDLDAKTMQSCEKSLDESKEKISELYQRLDCAIEKELPGLCKE